MDNARTTVTRPRANRRARVLSSRGRVRPRRLGLSKVVDVVSNSNDMLGTTVGSKKDGKYSPAVLSAFGENHLTTQPPNHQTFFTGKLMVEGLGNTFLMRNYRAGLAKWQSADPMGYPDGWNQLAYCGNGVTSAVDLWGCARKEHRLEEECPVVWTCPQDGNFSYGYNFYGVCDGYGHIKVYKDQINDCIQTTIKVRAPGLYPRMADPYVTYGDFKIQSVIGTCDEGVGYYDCDWQIVYTIQYEYKVDKETTISVKKLVYADSVHVHLECHHRE